jgi:hypothetical protein
MLVNFDLSMASLFLQTRPVIAKWLAQNQGIRIDHPCFHLANKVFTMESLVEVRAFTA